MRVFIFLEKMKNRYYKSLVKYFLFIRLLTRLIIKDRMIFEASTLMKEFIFEFDQLYGKNNCTYNLHAHNICRFKSNFLVA